MDEPRAHETGKSVRKRKPGLEKDGPEESVHGAALETQTWRTDLQTRVGNERERVR